MKLLFAVVALAFCVACSDDDAPESIYGHYDVDVLYAPNGLGDGGYCDMIRSGVLRSVEQYAFNLKEHCPGTKEEGWEIFRQWYRDYGKGKDRGRKKLFVFASNAYGEQLRNFAPPQMENRSLMLFEVAEGIDNVCTFRLGMYGAACYLGNLVAHKVSSAALLAANPYDRNLKECVDGFREGFLKPFVDKDVGGDMDKEPEIIGDKKKYIDAGTLTVRYLSDEPDMGFAMPDSAFRLASGLYRDYGFVFPLAGGSNMGVLQNMDKFPQGVYTAGVDVDMNHYSPKVLASLEKRMDLAVERNIFEWLNGRLMEGHTYYGLDTEFVEVTISEAYREAYAPILPGLEEKAMEKEFDFLRRQ